MDLSPAAWTIHHVQKKSDYHGSPYGCSWISSHVTGAYKNKEERQSLGMLLTGDRLSGKTARDWHAYNSKSGTGLIVIMVWYRQARATLHYTIRNVPFVRHRKWLRKQFVIPYDTINVTNASVQKSSPWQHMNVATLPRYSSWYCMPTWELQME